MRSARSRHIILAYSIAFFMPGIAPAAEETASARLVLSDPKLSADLDAALKGNFPEQKQ